MHQIEQFDVNGAVREAAEEAGIDRSAFLRRGALGAAGLLGAGAILGAPEAQATISTRRKSLKNDYKILNFALTLEYLESDFYALALRTNQFADTQTATKDQVRRFCAAVSTHESAHEAALKKALGRHAIKSPTFDFGDAIQGPKFIATAVTLEDTGVMAYSGQGPNIKTPAYVRAAISILDVEARQAGWARYLNGGGDPDAPEGALPAPQSFNPRASERKILSAVGATGFIKSKLPTSRI